MYVLDQCQMEQQVVVKMLSGLLYVLFIRVKSENYMLLAISIIKYIFFSYQSIKNTYQKTIKALIAFYHNLSIS